VRETYQIREDRQDEDQDNEDINDSGYWSSDDLPLKEADEVTDSYFYDNLWESAPEECTFDYDLKSPPDHLKSPPEDVQSVDDQLESPSGFFESTQADGDLFQDEQELGDVVSPTTNDWKTWENATVDGDVFQVRARSPPRVARLDGLL
jgi:hypothetical protein